MDVVLRMHEGQKCSSQVEGLRWVPNGDRNTPV